MKTIFCPIDSSVSSYNLSRFAAHLSADVEAKLILTPIEAEAKSKVTAGGWEEKEEAFEQLGEIHDLLKEIYHISCAIDEQTIAGSVYKRISEMADQYDMMLMGMKIPSMAHIDLNRLVQETLVPVYLMPDKYEYNKVKQILYLYEHRHEPEPPLMTLNWLADWLDAEVKFISILQSNSSYKERDKLTHQQQNIERHWQSTRPLNFETVVHDDASAFLQHYVEYWTKNDLLVMSLNHHKFMERLWHKSIFKRLLKYASNPFMVIHR